MAQPLLVGCDEEKDEDEDEGRHGGHREGGNKGGARRGAGAATAGESSDQDAYGGSEWDSADEQNLAVSQQRVLPAYAHVP